MLLAETGRALVVETARNAAASGAFARVVVATDAPEVEAVAREAGLEAVPTRADHASGTDRVDEAWRALASRGERAEVVVGVQGDEPELEPSDLVRLVAAFDDPAVELATLAAPFADEREAEAPQAVKVVVDARGDALYFSRARIPHRGHGGEPSPALRHVGVYAFRPDALGRFAGLPRGRLERAENLEQLRWLELGGRLRVVEIARAPQGIDTRADYDAFVARRRAADADVGTHSGSGAAPRAPSRTG
jgi:3-deoxy-manno-octulosonate cytidylyltransferase (CMP-KDO synthetase)